MRWICRHATYISCFCHHLYLDSNINKLSMSNTFTSDFDMNKSHGFYHTYFTCQLIKVASGVFEHTYWQLLSSKFISHYIFLSCQHIYESCLPSYAEAIRNQKYATIVITMIKLPLITNCMSTYISISVTFDSFDDFPNLSILFHFPLSIFALFM